MSNISIAERLLAATVKHCSSFEEALSSEKKINYFITRSGMMELRKEKVGCFISKAKKVVGNKYPEVKEEIDLKIPKIPYYFIMQAFSYFEDVINKYNGIGKLEVWWNASSQTYELVCPKQFDSGKYLNFEVTERNENDILTLVFLSNANYSEESDEPCINLVLDSSNKSYTLFMSIERLWYSLEEYTDVFEGHNLKLISNGIEFTMNDSEIVFMRTDYPAEWLEGIIEVKKDQKTNGSEIDNINDYIQTLTDSVTELILEENEDGTEEVLKNEVIDETTFVIVEFLNRLNPTQLSEFFDELVVQGYSDYLTDATENNANNFNLATEKVNEINVTVKK